MEIQLKQEKQHTLKIKVSCSRKLCTISCSRYGEVGQWLYTVTTIFRNEGYRIEDSMNETRSIRTMIDCVKTYHQFYKKNKQNLENQEQQPNQPNSLKIKVKSNSKHCIVKHSKYRTLGKWQYSVITVFGNATKPLTEPQIEQLSIDAMDDCRKKYNQCYKKNNENLTKQVNLVN